MTDQQLQFLNDFDSVAHAFDASLEVNIETSIGRTVAGPYAEMTVRAYKPIVAGRPQVTVACVNGHTKAEALTNLTVALRTKYAGQPALSQEEFSATDEQKKELLSLINRGCFDRRAKNHVLLRINRYSEAQAQAKVEELQLLIERQENGPFGVSGSAEYVDVA